jgi:hypothetical protein
MNPLSGRESPAFPRLLGVLCLMALAIAGCAVDGGQRSDQQSSKESSRSSGQRRVGSGERSDPQPGASRPGEALNSDEGMAPEELLDAVMSPPASGKYLYDVSVRNRFGSPDAEASFTTGVPIEIEPAKWRVKTEWRMDIHPVSLIRHKTELWSRDALFREEETFQNLYSGKRLECRYEPPLMALRFPIVLGDKWEVAVDCDRRDTQRYEVVGFEDMRVSREDLDAVVIRRVSHHGDRTNVYWFSPQHRLFLKLFESTKSNETTQVLRSTAPDQ